MYKTVFKLIYFECSSFPIIVMITSTHRIKIHEVSHEFLSIPDLCVFVNDVVLFYGFGVFDTDQFNFPGRLGW